MVYWILGSRTYPTDHVTALVVVLMVSRFSEYAKTVTLLYKVSLVLRSRTINRVYRRLNWPEYIGRRICQFAVIHELLSNDIISVDLPRYSGNLSNKL